MPLSAGMSALSRRFAVLAVGALLGAPVVSAQTPMQFGLGAGVSIPTGTTGAGLKTGWHATGLVQFSPPSLPVGFQIDASYRQLGFDGGGGKDRLIDGTADVVYNIAVAKKARYRPYLIGGVGVYNVKAIPDVGTSLSDTKFGINAGAGFNFVSSGVGFFVEARFHDVFVEGSNFQFIPITAGVRFGGS